MGKRTKAERDIAWANLLEVLAEEGVDPDVCSDSLKLVYINDDVNPARVTPLAIGALLNGVKEPDDKDSFDKIFWAGTHSKPLNSWNEEEKDFILDLIEKNCVGVMELPLGKKYENILHLKKDGESIFENGSESMNDLSIDAPFRILAAKIEKESYSFTPNELHSIKFNYDSDLSYEKSYEVARYFSLSDKEAVLFRMAELSLDELMKLPFVKEIENPEEQKKHVKNLAAGLAARLYSKDELSEEHLLALENEGLDYKDIIYLALRQGVSFETYMDRMMGKEPLPGDNGDVKETEGEQYARLNEEINSELRGKAKNPVESLMAETMIEMKNVSVKRGSREAMEICAAKYIVLKGMQSHLGLAPGEATVNDADRTEKINELLAKLDKATDEILQNESFRYYIKTMDSPALAAISHGNSTEALDGLFESVRDLIKNKALKNDYLTRIDRVNRYSEWAVSKEIYFPGRFAARDRLFKPIPNPFTLTLERGGLTCLAVSKMLENGFDIEDVLDPDKLKNVKRTVGEEVFEQCQHEENREAVVKTYLKGLHKLVEYSNRQMMQLKSLNPADIADMEVSTFFAVGSLMKDAAQELGRMEKQVAFSKENEAEFNLYTDYADALDKFYETAERTCRQAVEDGWAKTSENNAVTAVGNMLHAVIVNKSVQRVRETAQNTGKTFAEVIREEENGIDRSRLSTMVLYSSAFESSINYVHSSISARVKNNLAASSELRQRLSNDLLSGEFEKRINLSFDSKGFPQIETDYFDRFDIVLNEEQKDRKAAGSVQRPAADIAVSEANQENQQDKADEKEYLDRLGITRDDAEKIKKALGTDILKERSAGEEEVRLYRAGFTANSIEEMAKRRTITFSECRNLILEDPVIWGLKDRIHSQTEMLAAYNNPNMESKADSKLLHLMGPNFAYDDELKISYASDAKTDDDVIREQFRQDNYSIPQNSHFTEKQAALFALASVSVPEIGKIKLTDIEGNIVQDAYDSDSMRAYDTYSILVENGMSGSVREGIFFSRREVIRAARANSERLMKEYAAGNKQEMAEALVCGILASARTMRRCETLSRSYAYNARLAAQYYDILKSDPEMMTYAKANGLVQDRIDEINTGREVSRIYYRMEEFGKKCVEKISNGEVPGDAETKEFMTLFQTCRYISKELRKGDENYRKGAEMTAALKRINELTQELVRRTKAASTVAERNRLKAENSKETQSLLTNVLGKRPLSIIMRDLGKPGAMDALIKMTEAGEEVRKADQFVLADILEAYSFGSDLKSIDESCIPGEPDPIGDVLIRDYGISAPKSAEERMIRENLDAFAAVETIMDRLQNDAVDRSLNDAAEEIDTEHPNPEIEVFSKVRTLLAELSEKEKALLARSEQEHLTAEEAKDMQQAYADIVAACGEYMSLSEEQGLSAGNAMVGANAPAKESGMEGGNALMEGHADPGTEVLEDEKLRLLAVQTVLDNCREAETKYTVLMQSIAETEKYSADNRKYYRKLSESLTPEKAGEMLKELNRRSLAENDEEATRCIFDRYKVVKDYMVKYDLKPEKCGITGEDLNFALAEIAKSDSEAAKIPTAEERIVERINIAYRTMGKEPITAEQYHALMESDTPEALEYRALKEIGELYRKKDSINTYDIHEDNPFYRTYKMYLRTGDTEEDRKFNDSFIERISTKEGQISLFTETLQQAATKELDFFYPKSDKNSQEDFYAFYRDNMGFCSTLFAIESVYNTLRQRGVQMAPAVERFYTTVRPSCEALQSHCADVVVKSSPYYPAFPEVDDSETAIGAFSNIIVSSKMDGPNAAETAELNLFANNGVSRANMYESDTRAAINQLKKEKNTDIPQDIRNYRWVTKGKEAGADKVIISMSKNEERTGFARLSEKEIQALDVQLEHPIVTPEEYAFMVFKDKINENSWVYGLSSEMSAMAERIEKTFGPEFSYDEKLLEERVYTEDKFKQVNYALPENCPFNEHQAALIGFSVFTTPEYAGKSKAHKYDSANLRADITSSMVVENVISGHFRMNIADPVNGEIAGARANTSEVISDYMRGFKNELSRSLGSAIRSSVHSITTTLTISESLAADAKIATECYEILTSDPDLLAIAKKKSYITDDAIDTIKAAKALSDLYTEFREKGRKYMDTVVAGNQPDREQTKEIVALGYTLKHIANHLKAAESENANSEVAKNRHNIFTKNLNAAAREESKAKEALEEARRELAQADVSQKKKLSARVDKLNNDWKEKENQYAKIEKLNRENEMALSRNRKADDFFINLGKPGAIDELKKSISSLNGIQEIAGRDPQKLIHELGMNETRCKFSSDDGKMSEAVAGMDAVDDCFMMNYGMRPQSVVTVKTLQGGLRDIENYAANLTAAQEGVHNGSQVYNDVEAKAKAILALEQKFASGEYSLNRQNLEKLKAVYDETITDCNAYIRRQKERNTLNAPADSKTGKRIKAVNSLLGYCILTKCRYQDAVNRMEQLENLQQRQNEILASMNSEQLGTLIKNLNAQAERTGNPEELNMIGSSMLNVWKKVKENGFKAEEYGLNGADLDKAAVILRRVGKQEEAERMEKSLQKADLVYLS